jgi:DNA repair exonuclease SbcCD nuclease subunit
MIAIFSDLHLGIKGDNQYWHSVAVEFIQDMVKTLKEKNIKDVFFLGDWFHNRNSVDVYTLNSTAKILRLLEDFSIHIFPGNHDLYFSGSTEVSSTSIFQGYNNIKYYDKPARLNIGDKSITLCPWGFNPLNSEIESSDYLFGHFEINTFQMNSSEHLCEEGFKLSDLLKKFNSIFSGHFHKAQFRKYSSGSIVYVGNPFQMNYGEAGDKKGFIILDVDTGKYSYHYNEISPKFIKMTLSSLIRKEPSKIGKEIVNNYLRLAIDKNITVDDMDELIKLLSSCQPLECDIDWDNKGFSSVIDTKTDFVALELMEAIKEYIGLLDVPNPKEVLQYLQKKYREISNVPG